MMATGTGIPPSYQPHFIYIKMIYKNVDIVFSYTRREHKFKSVKHVRDVPWPLLRSSLFCLWVRIDPVVLKGLMTSDARELRGKDHHPLFINLIWQ